MDKEYVNPESLFRSLDYGFSQVVVASGRKTIYISGQTAWNAEKSLIGGQDFAAQTTMAFRNVRTAVEAAGGTITDVVSLRLYIVDFRPEKAGAVSGALRELFPGDAKPATTWVGVVCLADPGFLIEVEATAVID
jgi:enamine deaminase RidA (YjgF/YER057c/UK114 family)